MQVATSANMGHRRLGHLNSKSLDILNSLDDSGMPDCHACAVRKSRQLAHPMTADHKVKLLFQLVSADLMEPSTPDAPRWYK